MRFFERFRSELKRYEEGVHELSTPASEAALAEVERRIGRALPEEYREFLAQWNGGYLFHDDYRLFGAAGARAELQQLRAAGGEIEFGEAPGGSLRFDGQGQVAALERSTEARSVEGSGFARWLDAVMVREGLIYDPAGEFRGDAFEGVELTEKVRRKRAEAAARIDPAAPAWQEELAEIHAAAGQEGLARAALERAVALDPTAPSPWFALAKLRRAAGEAAPAAEAFARAAENEREPEEAAFAWANAARSASEAGRADADRLGERAAVSYPSLVAEQRAAAEHLLSEGDLDGAIERLSLAVAVAPRDGELAQALARARARTRLRPL